MTHKPLDIPVMALLPEIRADLAAAEETFQREMSDVLGLRKIIAGIAGLQEAAATYRTWMATTSGGARETQA